MLTVRNALAGVLVLSDESLDRLVSVSLATSARSLTDVGLRALAGTTTLEDLLLIERLSAPLASEPWVTAEPPSYMKRRFGPSRQCGDMAAHSLGYN